jgi:hypothetical protein
VYHPDQPQEPLEVCDSTMLKLCVNGVRRAKWYEKLGFQRKYVIFCRAESQKNPLSCTNSFPLHVCWIRTTFLVNLRSLRPLGGIVPSISVLVERVYPLMYLESFPHKVVRNQRGEDLVQQRTLVTKHPRNLQILQKQISI